MQEGTEYVARDGINQELVQVINVGLFDHKAQVTEFFAHLSGERDLNHSTQELVFTIHSPV
jgi:hypothetical protein